MIKNTPTLKGRAVFLGLLTIALVIVAPIGHGWAQGAKPELIDFPSGDLALKGFVWKPAGPGPFPAIVWNHGSEKLPGTVDSIGPYFVSRGYTFLVPHRRGQGRSPGAYIMDQLNAATSPEQRSLMLVALNEVHLQDQLAALAYLRSLPYVDQNLLVGHGSFLWRPSDHVGRRTQIRLSRRRRLFRCRSDLEGITGFARPSDGRRQQGNDTSFLSSGRKRLRSNAQPRLE